MTRFMALGLILLLAACAQPAATPRIAPVPPSPAPVSPTTAWVIGQSPDAVIARLGPATFARETPSARHLQFAYVPCILDVYFYPPQPGAALLGTFVDARSERGPAMDPVACIAAQRERRINPQKFLQSQPGAGVYPPR